MFFLGSSSGLKLTGLLGGLVYSKDNRTISGFNNLCSFTPLPLGQIINACLSSRWSIFFRDIIDGEFVVFFTGNFF